jgi:hypothetical protein
VGGGSSFELRLPISVERGLVPRRASE